MKTLLAIVALGLLVGCEPSRADLLDQLTREKAELSRLEAEQSRQAALAIMDANEAGKQSADAWERSAREGTEAMAPIRKQVAEQRDRIKAIESQLRDQ